MDTDTDGYTAAKITRRTHAGQLTKLYNKLERNMITYDNVDTVNALFDKLCERFKQFKQPISSVWKRVQNRTR